MLQAPLSFLPPPLRLFPDLNCPHPLPTRHVRRALHRDSPCCHFRPAGVFAGAVISIQALFSIVPGAAFAADRTVVTTSVGEGRKVAFSPQVLSKELFRKCMKSRKDLEKERRKNLVRDAFQAFSESYGGRKQVDWEQIKERLAEKEVPDNMEGCYRIIREMLAEVEDPYTHFMTPEELRGTMRNLEAETVGYGLGFSTKSSGWLRRKKMFITSVVPGSAAFDAGMRKGDEVTNINSVPVGRLSDKKLIDFLFEEGRSCVTLSYKRCLKCEEGQTTSQTRPLRMMWNAMSAVTGRLEVSANGANTSSKLPTPEREFVEREVKLKKRKLILPTVYPETIVTPAGRVAYLLVTEFAGETANEARRALKAFRQNGPVGLYVLDFRDNAGGRFDMALEFASHFLPTRCVITCFVGGDNKSSSFHSSLWNIFSHTRVLHKPLVVLVNEGSASAAELVAASIRENCRGLLIGSETYGKGTVQVIIELQSGEGLSVTTGMYKTPKGNTLSVGRGLKPDLVMNSLPHDSSVVMRLFGKGKEKRLRWVKAKLASCSALSEIGRTTSTPSDSNTDSLEIAGWNPFIHL